MPLNVLIVPDKFKGTLTAQAAATAIARGWRRAHPQDRLELLPMSDGGDGFGFPSRTISGLEMSLLGVEKPEGGVSEITLRAPDGTVYGLGIRPLLPDEQR